ncbi:hypothetical protein RJ640_002248 [Escallonia rubra]|uniref:Uncharacterized protein n=1 Tax=Escallonia rubra TaxID=112253 RepID=A0AA88U1Y0_9ASTE|nr:hypothetical protein RJ640_002248 [Escallonia rubra]
MVIVSLWCIQTVLSSRPSMTRVVEMLERSLQSLQILPKPVLSSPPVFDCPFQTRSLYDMNCKASIWLSFHSVSISLPQHPKKRSLLVQSLSPAQILALLSSRSTVVVMIGDADCAS